MVKKDYVYQKYWIFPRDPHNRKL